MPELEVRYARSRDGLHLAYAILGGYGPTLVMLYGNATHLRLNHEEPVIRHFHERLATFFQVALMDERGRGMSDPVPSSLVPTLEERMDDLLCVLDAMAPGPVSLFASGNAGPLALLVAASHPHRVDRLVLFNTFATLVRGEDYPIGFPMDILDEFARDLGEMWGTDADDQWFKQWYPGGDEEFLRRRAVYRGSAASPGQAEAILRASFNTDVRQVLPAVNQRVLVLHRSEERIIPPRFGAFLASHLQRAWFVELAGAGTTPYLGDADEVIGQVEEFVTGVRSARDEDRVLATVLFSDIVDSTRRAAAMGDNRWRELLDDHDDMVTRHVERFRGELVKRTGDGFLATFDGPVRAIRCAMAVAEAAKRLGLAVRCGLHTGECEVRGDDIAGIAVHMAARICALAKPSEVLVSGAIPPLLAGSDLRFRDAGTHILKGVPGEWHLLVAEQ